MFIEQRLLNRLYTPFTILRCIRNIEQFEKLWHANVDTSVTITPNTSGDARRSGQLLLTFFFRNNQAFHRLHRRHINCTRTLRTF